MNPNTRRIVLLGKTGCGKSSLGNAILGEEVFNVNYSPNSETQTCQSETRSVNGRKVQMIDTPGFFDTDPNDKKPEPVVKCMIECAPGPHAFLIVLKVEKYTKHEKEVIAVILEYFSDEALKFATVVFTHGDQLPQNVTIRDFVSENPHLNELVEKCGGRCHVFDNKHWNNEQQDEYRSNRFQIQELLKTIDKTVEENEGGHYTNEMLKSVEEKIQQEEGGNKQEPGNKSEGDREEAKQSAFDKILPKLAGTATGILVGAFLGGLAAFISTLGIGGGFGVSVVIGAVLGGTAGGYEGFEASAKADTPKEAVKLVWEQAILHIKKLKERLNTKKTKLDY